MRWPIAHHEMADDLPAGAPRQRDSLSGTVAGFAGRHGVAVARPALADPLAPYAEHAPVGAAAYADHAPVGAAARGGDFWYTAA